MGAGFSAEPTRFSLTDVAAAESKLRTSLPDDFWIVSALRIPALRRILIQDHSGFEPPTPSETLKRLLRAHSSAKRPLPRELVAIADLNDGKTDRWLCVRRGVSYEQRNQQQVFIVQKNPTPETTVTIESFAKFLRMELTSSYGVVQASKNSISIDLDWMEEELEDTDSSTRSPGPIEMSDEMDLLLRACRGETASSFVPEHPTELSLATVMHVERELGTTLPDDYWTAVACYFPAFAEVGIGAAMPHGEPAEPELVGEAILTIAADAEGHIPHHLVAIADLSMFVGENGEQPASFLCANRGVSFEERNTTALIPVLDGEAGKPTTVARFIRDQLAKDGHKLSEHASSRESPVLTGKPLPRRAKEKGRVHHPKFGMGTVISACGGGEHRTLEVDFEVGRKRLLARFVEELD